MTDPSAVSIMFNPVTHREHGIEPVALFWQRSPGFSCEQCGTWAEVSHKTFRNLFGMTFIEFKRKLKEQEKEGGGDTLKG